VDSISKRLVLIEKTFLNNFFHQSKKQKESKRNQINVIVTTDLGPLLKSEGGNSPIQPLPDGHHIS